MVGVGRDLWGSSLPKQGHPAQAAQDLVQAGLEYLQRRTSDFPAKSAEPELSTILSVSCRSTSVLRLPRSHMGSEGGTGTDVQECDPKHSSQVIVAQVPAASPAAWR